MRIAQQAGGVEVYAYTDGWPISVTVKIDGIEHRVGVSGLHDLRYCIERVLSQLPEKDRV